MVSFNEIKDKINISERLFEECWEIISMFKNENDSSNDNSNIKNFQPKLAEALFNLDKTYRKIKSREKYLISRKERYNIKWFEIRLKKLKQYRQALKETIKIGKGLGDAFAWIFYINNKDYLYKHLKHEEISHTPPGIGGIGELEFVKKVQMLNKDTFILYHGITSLLREVMLV